MGTYGLPKSAVIGTQISWVSLVEGYSSATHDLLWLFGAVPEQGVAQTPPQTGWTTTADFDGQPLGPCAWTLSVGDKSTLVVTEIATGSIFLETPEYNTHRLTAESAEQAILKIMQGGGYQSTSIKGRSSSKFGLADLKAIASQARNQMNRMLNRDSANQILVRFGS